MHDYTFDERCDARSGSENCQAGEVSGSDRSPSLWPEGALWRLLHECRSTCNGVAEAKEERGVLGPPESEQVGLSFLYDGLYRYESSAATHATLLAVDLLLKKVPSGLVLRSEPTTQFAPLPVYLHGAELQGRGSSRACMRAARA